MFACRNISRDLWKKVNYMLEINILRNYQQKNEGVLNDDF